VVEPRDSMLAPDIRRRFGGRHGSIPS
jgi:hypothetical protein